MKRLLLTLGAVALVTSGLYSSPLAAEGRADRMNETRPYQGLDMMIQHLQAIHGPTAAGPGMAKHKDGMMKQHGQSMMKHHGKGMAHPMMHHDTMQGLTAHQRKRLIFGSNN